LSPRLGLRRPFVAGRRRPARVASLIGILLASAHWRGHSGAVALLVFLAATAWAGIVAADLFLADHLLGLCIGSRTDHLHLRLLAPLSPLVFTDQCLFF